MIEINVPNWRDYNPRPDLKRPIWFRLGNDLFDDPKLISLTHEDIMAWIYVLCLCCKANASTITTSVQHVEHVGRFKIKKFTDSLECLAKLQMITYSRTESVRTRSESVGIRTLRDETRHNERDITRRDETNAHVSSALADLWNAHCDKLPKVLKCNASRNRKSKKLWADADGDPNEYWTNVIKRIAESDFCNGAGNSAWVATFDWLLKPDTHLRVMEGKYDNRIPMNKADQSFNNLKNLWQDTDERI